MVNILATEFAASLFEYSFELEEGEAQQFMEDKGYVRSWAEIRRLNHSEAAKDGVSEPVLHSMKPIHQNNGKVLLGRYKPGGFFSRPEIYLASPDLRIYYHEYGHHLHALGVIGGDIPFGSRDQAEKVADLYMSMKLNYVTPSADIGIGLYTYDLPNEASSTARQLQGICGGNLTGCDQARIFVEGSTHLH
jgi:hypothetical protein